MKRVITAAVLLAGGIGLGFAFGAWSIERTILAPVIAVRIDEVDLDFRARLDSGAVVSSINAHDIVVIGGGPRPAANDVGKTARFVLINDNDERREMTARIEQVRGIRMGNCRAVRYHVFLTIEYGGRALRVLTNLNDRSQAGGMLLLGRNWLRHGYAVGPVEEAEI
ncbi:MAG: RimK/LysX family protein [Gammaproteobacteria bacterium]